jgi:hypothetical protein
MTLPHTPPALSTNPVTSNLLVVVMVMVAVAEKWEIGVAEGFPAPALAAAAVGPGGPVAPVAPFSPAGPGAPRGPGGPVGSGPALKSSARSERFFTLDEVTAPS